MNVSPESVTSAPTFANSTDHTGDVIGQPFFVMDFLDGAATGRDDRSMSSDLASDFVRRLHELHQVDWARELAFDGSAGDATHGQIERWHRIYLDATDGLPIPLLEEGAAWLHHHAPPAARIGIVHGDPGPGNFVHDGERVLAFTDWEFAHVGDPMEDWVYLVTMRGNRTMARDEWLALFESVAAVTLRDDDLHYWSVFNHFKGACANATCRRVFATTNPAPNMGIIGTALHQRFVRRVAALTVAFAVPYTVFSEWLHTEVRGSWAFSELLPVVPVLVAGLSRGWRKIFIGRSIALQFLRRRLEP